MIQFVKQEFQIKQGFSNLKPGFAGILSAMVAILVASCASAQFGPATESSPAPLPTQVSLNRNATPTFVPAPTTDEEEELDSSTRSSPVLTPTPTPTPSAANLNRVTITLAPPTPEPTPVASDDLEAQVVALINHERTNRDLLALTMDPRLMAAAQAHSQDMAAHNFFDHIGSDGSNPGDRITRQGYQWMFFAENLACEHFTPEDVVQAWLDSPGHRANMLAPEPEHIGIGVAAAPGADCTPYWTAIFAAGG